MAGYASPGRALLFNTNNLVRHSYRAQDIERQGRSTQAIARDGEVDVEVGVKCIVVG